MRDAAKRLALDQRAPAVAGTVAELALILAVGLLYVRAYTDFDHAVVPGGKEFLGTTGWIWVGTRSLLDYGELPLWNHYFGTGLPYLGDPISHIFSPLALLPALLLGVEDGPRLTVPLSIIASGFAQYYLARALGLSAPARVVSALVYMMNGQMAVRFETGVYAFGIAFPYIPLCYAFLIKSMTTGRGAMYPLLGGASIALLMFAGNAYYFVFTMPGLVAAAAFYALDVAPRARPRIRPRAVLRAAAMASWAVGLSAIQWMPWLATDGYIAKISDPLLEGSPTVLGSLRGLFRSDPAYYLTPADGMLAGQSYEYYTYIGALLIPLFVFSPLALLAASRRRAYALCVALFAFYLLWSSAAHTPFRFAYEWFPRLYDFRYTSRVMAVALPAAAAIPAFAIDAVWRLGREGSAARLPRRAALASTAAAAVLVVAFSWFALRDLYDANAHHYAFVPANTAHEEIGRWLAARDGKPFLYDRPDAINGLAPSFDVPETKQSRTIWGWHIDGTASGITDDTPAIQLLPKPRYLILFTGAPAPLTGVPVAQVSDRTVYEFPDAPPYAGFVRRGSASLHPQAFELPHTQPDGFAPWPFEAPRAARASWPSNNQALVEGAPAAGQDLLVVLESYVTGWRVEVDGRDAGAPENVGGLLGVRARAGDHRYLFVFDPAYARRGVAVTVGTLLGAVLWYLRAPFASIARRVGARRRVTPARRS
jgi:hypothetical protein